MKKIGFLLLLFSQFSFAGIEQAPKNFMSQHGKAVFVDFLSAEYEIVYDTHNRTANVVSKIQFDQSEKGHPLFDLTNNPISIIINDHASKSLEIVLPNNASKMRLLAEELPIGIHTMVIKSSLTTGVKFKTPKFKKKYKNVSSAFFIRDLTDRMFLEQFLPTNLEFDNYKMTMDIRVTGTKRFHSLFANGAVTKLTPNHYRVEFPEYYTCSSVFFHLVPINKFVRWYLTYDSIDGRKIPLTIYSKFRVYNYFLKKKTFKVLAELEKDYGPWPHDQVIIYGTGLSGGMEYAGATETSIVSLGHELQHSYFAKGIHPANGNSGWMDEAIASWRDKKHQSIEIPFYPSANLAAHSSYTRKTDKRSYVYGRSFMAYMDFKLRAAGHHGLKDFLSLYLQKRKYTTVTTADFKSDLEDYSGLNLTDDFKQFVWGKDVQENNKHLNPPNPHHPAITREQLDTIL